MFFGKKNPADKAVELFTAALRRDGFNFNTSDEKPSVFIFCDDRTFSFFFDDDGESVSFKVFSIFEFGQGELAKAYKFCNDMNNEWRWFRFYVDSDNELTVDMDAVIDANSTAAVCMEILRRARSIVGKVYKEHF